MAVVHLSGNIDYHTVPAARRRLLSVLRGADLDIDLEHLTRIDTSGLATLVEVFEVARRAGRAVHLVHVDPKVREMMRLVHLEGLFSLRHSEGTGYGELG